MLEKEKKIESLAGFWNKGKRVGLPFPYLLGEGSLLHQGPKVKSSICCRIFLENGRNPSSEACSMLKKVKVSSERAEAEEKAFVWESSYMTTKGGFRNV